MGQRSLWRSTSNVLGLMEVGYSENEKKISWLKSHGPDFESTQELHRVDSNGSQLKILFEMTQAHSHEKF